MLVIEGPDRTGKSTIAQQITEEYNTRSEKFAASNHWYYLSYKASAQSDIGPGKPLGKVLDHLFETDMCRKDPVLFEMVMTAVNYATQAEVVLPLLQRGDNLVVDRWWPSALVYGQHQGLDLNYILASKQQLILPDAMLIVSRDKCLPGREEKQNSFDTDEFQIGIRRLYEWLLPWWKENVPTCPAGMLKLGNKDDEAVSRRRSLRRMRDIVGKEPWK